MISVSKRGLSLPSSPIRKLKPYADAAVAKGLNVHYLNIGQPDIETPAPMLKKLKELDTKIIAYGPSQGLKEYQDVLVRYYQKHNIELSTSDIIVTTGGSEAIIMAFTVCLDKGDEVILPEPFYTNYNGFAAATGVILKPLTTTIEDDWELPTAEEIEASITSKTKAIMICNPNNPTGKVYNAEALLKLAKIAKKHNLYLFSDEVYREFIFSGEKHSSLLDFEGYEENVVMMDSISKRFSACGARIGALVSRNKDVMKAALAYGQARLCPPTLDQMMAVASEEIGDEYFVKMLAEYKGRRDTVVEALEKMDNVIYQVPDGAFYIVMKLPVENAEDFVIWLLSDFSIDGETVMLAPAEGFYATPGLGRSEARIAFVLDVEKTKRAMHIISEGLKKYLSL
ncbi:pyridoxal phosphate-dependent aminotransferase [bacterium]|nr:pyridoxal phosphate-dependent aminotransferase [bacterium]